MLIIELEDRGQDFTEWKCDENGIVVECSPFQGWLWEGVRVIGATDLSRGDVVDFVDKQGRLRTLNYRVARVTQPPVGRL
ncbi:hypothetical protein WS70_25635 [Burkholderia mayonis]|uniref:Uncharacterized protein n=1 Tax=Burkholderia mayonis TaxID=1385591 RepID=A0A1B4FN63_9BURK|nr:hypothetical protein [Burkholderia mayonis]AOJ05103.1 hypothetical protein WS70_25635 [Burkholderia mayonis]KVE41645.1 hypothetical protein WS70_13500 [Burkholderia mayonis]